METPPDLDPARLPPGTQVGPWRVVSWSAQGTYGTVYRAVSWGQDEPVPVALKLAIHPEDPRFRREATLLSRLDHPSLPVVLDHGHWRHPTGVAYPYVTMGWVEGSPLYGWVRARNATSGQVFRLLAHLARALQTIHAANAVHRDVKGENVLVRHADSRAVLIDLGSSNYQGAARLTWRTQPPGTPAHRSPQAWSFLLRFGLASDAHYVATAADDVFALGVTAYRLVTGQYPPSTEPGLEEARVWEPGGPGPKPPLELNPRVDPQLSAVILRMLSVSPEARGKAKELADALESAAECLVPEADQPLMEREVPRPPATAQAEAAPIQDRKPTGKKAPDERARPWVKALPWLAAASAGLLLIVWAGQAVSTRIGRLQEQARLAPAAQERDAGTVAVGDTSVTAASSSSEAPPDEEPVASDMPEKVFPGQAQPDRKGQCPLPGHVALKGRCWAEQPMEAEECEGSGYVYVQGKCYTPVFSTRRRPTSNPTDPR